MSMDIAAALADADLCVKCGLCLPHCPTYRLQQHEADGPRGRIALTQGLLTGALTATPSLKAHLDGCLSCRACEAVCPAKVPYGRVIDAAREALATPERTQLPRWMHALLGSSLCRGVLRLGLWLLHFFDLRGKPRLPLAPWLRAWPVVRRLRGVSAPPQAKLALFVGCLGDIAEREVLHDALRLFRAAGVEVAIPPMQGCCGAIAQHGGLPDAAATCATRNATAFAGCDTVMPVTPGCGAALRDLGTIDAPALAPKLRDLCAALADALDAPDCKAPQFKPQPLRVGIHTACTQAHVFGAASATRRLLARIPGIELIDLAHESGCCGAAGTAFVTQPQQAAKLLAPKLKAATDVDVIVSANIGCSMHFLGGLRGAGRRTEVLHPVSFLARALRD